MSFIDKVRTTTRRPQQRRGSTIGLLNDDMAIHETKQQMYSGNTTTRDIMNRFQQTVHQTMQQTMQGRSEHGDADRPKPRRGEGRAAAFTRSMSERVLSSAPKVWAGAFKTEETERKNSGTESGTNMDTGDTIRKPSSERIISTFNNMMIMASDQIAVTAESMNLAPASLDDQLWASMGSGADLSVQEGERSHGTSTFPSLNNDGNHDTKSDVPTADEDTDMQWGPSLDAVMEPTEDPVQVNRAQPRSTGSDGKESDEISDDEFLFSSQQRVKFKVTVSHHDVAQFDVAAAAAEGRILPPASKSGKPPTVSSRRSSSSKKTSQERPDGERRLSASEHRSSRSERRRSASERRPSEGRLSASEHRSSRNGRRLSASEHRSSGSDRRLSASERRPSERRLSSSERRPSERRLSSSERRPSERRLSGSEKRPSARRLAANEKRPSSRRLSASERRPSGSERRLSTSEHRSSGSERRSSASERWSTGLERRSSESNRRANTSNVSTKPSDDRESTPPAEMPPKQVPATPDQSSGWDEDPFAMPALDIARQVPTILDTPKENGSLPPSTTGVIAGPTEMPHRVSWEQTIDQLDLMNLDENSPMDDVESPGSTPPGPTPRAGAISAHIVPPLPLAL